MVSVLLKIGDLVTVGGTGLWPGGGRGGSPLEGIASPGLGRTRLEESQRIGRQARMTRATPRVVVAAINSTRDDSS